MTTLSDGKAWFLALVESALRRTDYHALYPARIVAQDAAGLLELVPDDSRIPGMTGVPIRPGIPGVSVKVAPGARVCVGFEGGNPSRPVATIWEASAVKELRITGTAKITIDCPDVHLGSDGGAPIARLGDVVEVLFPNIAAVSGTVGVPPATQPFAGIVQITESLVGIITSGATRAKAS